MLNKKIYRDSEEVAQAFAAFFVRQIEDKNIETVAISGGSTPKRLFQILAEKYADAKFWDQLKILWVDERMVPHEDDQSNYKMTRLNLLDHIKSDGVTILPVEGGDDPDQEVERYGTVVEQFCDFVDGLPSIDMVLLGMGDDGHTASIFPDNMTLLNDNRVTALAKHPESGQVRVTLTGPVINNAKEVHFLVTGANKKERLAEVEAGNEKGKALPSFHIAPKTGDLTWWLDDSSVGK